ncbi:DUF6878 family protein [Burkholderia ubonensis]|uniref:DUF6878 family protein n=1 Tax=Burkholderia ubonensis TaxID=101571 RepID=UPI000B04798B|nr:DUF6878 family protein [Burkholderia ubonensis]
MSDTLHQCGNAETAAMNAAAAPPDPILTANKPILLHALRSVGAASAVVSYSGSGDEGNANEVHIFDADNAVIAPTIEVEVNEATSLYGDGKWTTNPVVRARPLVEALSDFADWAIALYHSGFQDGNGGEGDVTFDVEFGTVRLDHRAAYIEYDHQAHDL